MAVENEGKGEVFFGMHFYPGVARYENPGSDPYTVFLNEDTIRTMDPSFAGRPVYVQHVEDVESDLDKLRTEVDGWVIKSFFNASDGKHWVQFLVCSERGLRAIKNGMRLSNCYVPKSFAQGGLWNGVSYAKEITGGEYEHLAIVPNPRYEESVIMTPEEFKKYNEDKKMELEKISNERKDIPMKFKFFKKTKVENSIDLEEMTVVLPKTGREVSITTLINDADMPAEEKKDMNSGMADPSHKVKMHDGSYCNVAELVEKHKALYDELESMKMKKEDGEDQDKEYEDKPAVSKDEEMPEVGHKENDEDDVKAKKKEDEEVKKEKQKNDKEKADRLRNAPLKVLREEAPIDLSDDKVARGKSRYGSK